MGQGTEYSYIGSKQQSKFIGCDGGAEQYTGVQHCSNGWYHMAAGMKINEMNSVIGGSHSEQSL